MVTSKKKLSKVRICAFYDYNRKRCTKQGMQGEKVKCNGKLTNCEVP